MSEKNLARWDKYLDSRLVLRYNVADKFYLSAGKESQPVSRLKPPPGEGYEWNLTERP